MRKLALLLSVLLFSTGCSLSASPQEAVGGGPEEYFSYQVPGSWQNKDGDWYEGRELRLIAFSQRSDPRLKKVQELTQALQALDRSGPRDAAENLYRLHPIRPGTYALPDQAELDAAWGKIERLRELFSQLAKENAKAERIDPARQQLEKIRQEYIALAGDLKVSAARLGTDLVGHALEPSQTDSTQLEIEGKPGVFFTAQSRKDPKKFVGHLAFKVDETSFLSLALHDKKPIELSRGEELAKSIRFGSQPPPPQKRERQERSISKNRLSHKSWVALLVLGFASLPAACGAAWGYRAPAVPRNERAASAGAAAFFFTAVSVALGICGYSILALSSLKSAPTGSGPMVGVAMLIFLTIYGAAAIATWITTCSLARIGARLGAPAGLLPSSLGAGVLAGIGCLIVPILMGWLR